MIPSGVSKYYGEVTVKRLVDGKEVTEVESMKYCYSTEITKVIIQEGIQIIGMEAFLYDIGMKSLVLPSTLKYIGYAAFRCCSNLKSVSFMGTRSQWESVKIEAHNECLLNASIKFVGDKYNYVDNEDGSITLTEYKNGTPIGDIIIPNEYDGKVVSSLGVGFFKNQVKITSISLPNSLESIQKSAFEKCSGLSSIEIPDSVKYIGVKAFKECSLLDSVVVSSTSCLETIDDEAFSLCISLRVVDLPRSLKSIGVGAFSGCSVLPGLILPSNLKKIGIGFLLNCISVREVVLDDRNEYFHIYDKCLYRNEDKSLIYCPMSMEGGIFLENGTEKIDSYAFHRCINISSVLFPPSLKEIGDAAFLGCFNLSTFNLHGVEKIGNRAFEDCISLQYIIVPSSAELGSDVFYSCSGVQSIHIEDGVKSLSSGLFHYCDNIRYVEVPKSLKVIQSSTFKLSNNTKVNFYFKGTYREWDKLERQLHSNIMPVVTCEEDWSWNDIRNDSVEITEFRGEYYPNKIYVPGYLDDKQVLSIGGKVFSNIEKVVEIVLPDSLKIIGQEAFSYCSGLKYINLPETLEDIGKYAFFRCASLMSIDIPSGLSIINEEIFRECSKLSSLVFHEGLIEIKTRAFSGCSNLLSMTIPSTVRRIYDSAFEICPKLNTVYYNGTESQYRDTSVIQIDSNNGRLNTYSYITYLVVEPRMIEYKINEKTVNETSSGSHVYPKVSSGDNITYRIYFKTPSNLNRVKIQATNEIPSELIYKDGSCGVYTLNSENKPVNVLGVSFQKVDNILSWGFGVDGGLDVYIEYVAIVSSSASNVITNRASVKIGDDDWIPSNKVQNTV